MWQVQIVVNRVRLIGILFCQLFVGNGVGGKVLYKMWNFLMVTVAPWILVTPMVVKIALYHSHLSVHSCFGIFLHSGIYGCVYFQSVGIEIYLILFAPFFQFFGNGFAKVQSLSVIVTFNVIVQLDRNLFE